MKIARFGTGRIGLVTATEGGNNGTAAGGGNDNTVAASGNDNTVAASGKDNTVAEGGNKRTVAEGAVRTMAGGTVRTATGGAVRATAGDAVRTGPEIVDVTTRVGVDPAEWPPVGPNRLIRDFERYADVLARVVEKGAAEEDPRVPLASVTLRTPVPWASKVIAYPVNYHDHGREMQAGYRADVQGFFLKPPSALSGAGEPVVLPVVPGREVHHEAELGIVIGKGGRDIPRARWAEHVFGYTCLLDMVVRGREERVFRKAFDTFCPVGPWITTADEVGDPTGLEMRLWVGDELRQHANTRDLVLDIPGMIEMASAVMTLQPGDIIATGTPAGVGPVTAGDTIRIWIERVGEMTVDVVQGTSGRTEVFARPYSPEIVRQH